MSAIFATPRRELPTTTDALIVLGVALSCVVALGLGMGFATASRNPGLHIGSIAKESLNLVPLLLAVSVARVRRLVTFRALVPDREDLPIALYAIFAGAAGGLIVGTLVLLADGLTPEPLHAKPATLAPLTFLIVAHVVINPVFEEVIFRWVVLRAALRTLPVSLAILLSAGLFAAGHMSGWSIVSAIGVGVVGGAALVGGRSLFAPVALHIAWSATMVFVHRTRAVGIVDNDLGVAVLLAAAFVTFSISAFRVFGVLRQNKVSGPTVGARDAQDYRPPPPSSPRE